MVQNRKHKIIPHIVEQVKGNSTPKPLTEPYIRVFTMKIEKGCIRRFTGLQVAPACRHGRILGSRKASIHTLSVSDGSASLSFKSGRKAANISFLGYFRIKNRTENSGSFLNLIQFLNHQNRLNGSEMTFSLNRNGFFTVCRYL